MCSHICNAPCSYFKHPKCGRDNRLQEQLLFIEELASLERFGGTASPTVSAAAAPTFYRSAKVARQEVGLTEATFKSFLF